MLTAMSLADGRMEQAKVNHETYRLILQQCYKCIRECNARRVFQTQYAVPAKYIGRQQYKHHHAVAYVRAKLVKGSFGVCAVPPTKTVLLICWGHVRPSTLPKAHHSPVQKSSDTSDLLELLRKS